MAKMNIDKIDNFGPIRSDRQGDVKIVGLEPARTPETSKIVSEDRLDFSSKAAEVGKLVDTLKAMPDVRTDRVADLRDQISAGTYNPTADEIAAAILNDEKI